MTKIQVTDEHIQKAINTFANGLQPSLSCPIALAVFEHTKNLAGVSRSHVGVWVSTDEETFIENIPLPQEARTFINNFDHRRYDDTVPFEFELDLPK